MPDIDHLWGNDLAVGPTGDLALIDGDDLTTQHIIRRLMTAVRGYIWHLDYGAGLPQRIGDTLDENVIRGIITTQIRLEGTVARTPAPTIKIDLIPNGIAVSIQYTSAITGEQIFLSFDVNN